MSKVTTIGSCAKMKTWTMFLRTTSERLAIKFLTTSTLLCKPTRWILLQMTIKLRMKAIALASTLKPCRQTMRSLTPTSLHPMTSQSKKGSGSSSWSK